MPAAENIHANLIAINGKGVLISGPSGSGKTQLALHLFRRCHHAGIDSQWIADDQVLLQGHDDRLVGSAPEAIRGKIEIRGCGIVEIPISEVREQEIALHALLVSKDTMTRMWEGQKQELAGIKIDTLRLGMDHLEAAGNAILAKLGQPIWV